MASTALPFFYFFGGFRSLNKYPSVLMRILNSPQYKQSNIYREVTRNKKVNKFIVLIFGITCVIFECSDQNHLHQKLDKTIPVKSRATASTVQA